MGRIASNRKNLTGTKFNKLKVISYSHTGKDRQAYWNCVCDCGTETTIRGYQLTSGRTKSCGCLRNFDKANSIIRNGEDNNNWKGIETTTAWAEEADDVKPRAFHTWIRNNNTISKTCERCGKVCNPDLASINGHNYTRNIEDYMWLCRSCHKGVDNGN